MPEITVTTTTTFDPERFFDMSEFIFADVFVVPNSMGKATLPGGSEEFIGIELKVWADPDRRSLGDAPLFVSWQQLGEAIAHIAAGTFTDYDGTTEREPSDYHVAAANAIMRDFDNADWDSLTEDLILQQAVFGKVIYG